jgi:hypothetical protein
MYILALPAFAHYQNFACACVFLLFHQFGLTPAFLLVHLLGVNDSGNGN